MLAASLFAGIGGFDLAAARVGIDVGLQGFPDGWTCLCGGGGDPWTCTCADGPRYRTVGNAVTVPVVEWVLRRLVSAQ